MSGPRRSEKRKAKRKEERDTAGCCASDGYYLPRGAVRVDAQRAAAGPAGPKQSGRYKTFF
jgi:hypothetical protein